MCSCFLICQSIKQCLYAQLTTSQDFWDLRYVQELGSENGKKPLAVPCKSKLLSLETYKLAGRGRITGEEKLKLTTNNFNFSSVSTFVSETSLGGCGKVTALGISHHPCAWAWRVKPYWPVLSDVARYLVLSFTILLAGLHFTWAGIKIKVKEQEREPNTSYWDGDSWKRIWSWIVDWLYSFIRFSGR